MLLTLHISSEVRDDGGLLDIVLDYLNIFICIDILNEMWSGSWVGLSEFESDDGLDYLALRLNLV